MQREVLGDVRGSRKRSVAFGACTTTMRAPSRVRDERIGSRRNYGREHGKECDEWRSDSHALSTRNATIR